MADSEAKLIQFTYKDYQGYTRQGAVHIPTSSTSTPAIVQSKADEVKMLLLSLVPPPVLKSPQLGGFELLGDPDSFHSIFSICSNSSLVNSDLVYKLVKLPIQFAVGQRLEACDLLTAGYKCVANILELDHSQRMMRINFDGWSDKFDYWCPFDSPNIAPVGTCAALGHTLQPPKGQSMSSFEWPVYLSSINAVAAPTEAFPHGFSIGPPTKEKCTSPTKQF
mmetsp:Transcript_10777/g.33064  ORF Transcript_10777/g.33064 Transcript_10777/m.33064 type:complete len:222 (+) Transcript_10777:104-769(+)|eukprot:CAMPEP_0177634532 /NCGR_PEP_ID=MMETSP0447-20121125/3417_1 /TAXON_ID=0 /ORGANISM="Stygamoeba regulata, Strain BSH-02190019" /LENGTH=221 /DNA_ID=CAMNT_0019136257 /DNA_START=36 /DNA_END=701 /DNA_ORIENTATION=+